MYHKPPRSSRNRRILAVALSIAVAAVFIVANRHVPTTGIGTYDEGLMAFGGFKILSGQAPYRDFALRFTPGGMYLYASLFKLFGCDIIVTRIAAIAVDAGLLLLLSGILLRVGRREAAFAVAFVYCFWGVSQFYFLWNTGLSLLWVLGAILVIVSCKDKYPLWPAIASGALCGASFWFKQNVGVFSLAGLLVFHAFDATENMFFGTRTGARRAAVSTIKNCCASFAGFAFVFAVPAAYYASQGALDDFFSQVFVEALKTKKGFLVLPGLFTGKFIFLTYICAAAVACSLQIRIIANRRYEVREARILAVCIMCTVVYFSSLLSGKDFSHVVQISSLTMLLMALFWNEFFELARLENRPAWLRTAVMTAFLLLLSGMCVFGAFRAEQNVGMAHEFGPRREQKQRLNLPGARYARVSEDRYSAYVGIFNAVNKSISPHDCVLVFPYDSIFNFILRRDNCLPATDFHQEVFNKDRARFTASVLNSGRIRAVILKDSTMPMKNSLSGGPYMYIAYSEVYQTIQKRFEKTGKFLYWEVYILKPDPAL